MINLFNDNVIEFSCHPDAFGAIPEPKPASKFLPEWYKRVKPHAGRENKTKFPIRTVKKCMPVLDAMNLGYIIPLPVDLQVITNHDLSLIKIEGRNPDMQPQVEFHQWCQVASEKWPIFKQDPIKFRNPWMIKTKPGYSCYFTSPINHFNEDFELIGGVVDTDKYTSTVNFPAVWKTPNFDDILPAGMPLVQVIPFKRDKEKLVVREQTEKEMKTYAKMHTKMSTRADVYKDDYREPR